MQSEALTQMLDSGLTPPEQAGQFNAVAADQALQAKNYDLVITRAQEAAAAGYKPDAVHVTLAHAYFGKSGTTKSSAEPQPRLKQPGLAARKDAADDDTAPGGQVQKYSEADTARERTH